LIFALCTYMKSSHILGLNSRNHLYLSRFNLRSGKRIADSKLLTKKFLKKLKLPHPRLITAFTEVSDVKNFDWNSLEDNFVIKPAGGYAGEGILLIRKRISRREPDDRRLKIEDSSGRLKVEDRKTKTGRSIFHFPSSTTTFYHPSSIVQNFQLMDGSITTLNDLKLHVMDILEGRFNRLNLQDTAIIEERVYKHPKFRRYAYKGTPDVRIIVFNKVPVMAALRLPTPESKGRANIHQGAIMVGIDLATGITTQAAHWDKPIKAIPGKTIDDRKIEDSGGAWKMEGRKNRADQSIFDRLFSTTTLHRLSSTVSVKHSSSLKLSGIQIPDWDRMMELAIQVQEHIPLGLMAVDFLIDPAKGPLIVELTARPGMGIQIANQAGLRRRIERVEGLEDVTPGRGIEVAKALFAERFSDKIMAERGVKVVSVFETVKLRDAKGFKADVPAKIDTGAFRSSINRELAEEMGLMKDRAVLWHDYYWSSLGREKRPVISVTFWLAGRKIETTANVSDRSKMKEKLLIGRRDLGTFMVRPGGK